MHSLRSYEKKFNFKNRQQIVNGNQRKKLVRSFIVQTLFFCSYNIEERVIVQKIQREPIVAFFTLRCSYNKKSVVSKLDVANFNSTRYSTQNLISVIFKCWTRSPLLITKEKTKDIESFFPLYKAHPVLDLSLFFNIFCTFSSLWNHAVSVNCKFTRKQKRRLQKTTYQFFSGDFSRVFLINHTQRTCLNDWFLRKKIRN